MAEASPPQGREGRQHHSPDRNPSGSLFTSHGPAGAEHAWRELPGGSRALAEAGSEARLQAVRSLFSTGERRVPRPAPETGCRPPRPSLKAAGARGGEGAQEQSPRTEPAGSVNSQPLLGRKSRCSLACGPRSSQPGRQSVRSAERATGGRLLCPLPGRSRASGGAGCASRPHRNHPVCLYHPQEHRTRVRVDKRSQPAGGRQWQWCARTPACPKGHTGGEPNRLSPHLAFSTLGARENPAAESTTVKPVIQRIKASPNHTDLIQQITNWQVAVLADLPINAQNKAAFPPFRLNPGSLRSQKVWGRRPDHHRLGRRGAARSALSGPWTFTRGTPETDLESLLLPGASRLCSHRRGGVQLRMRTSCAVHKERQRTWLGLKGRLEQTHSCCPPGPAFHSPPAAASLRPPGLRPHAFPGKEGRARRPPLLCRLKVGS